MMASNEPPYLPIGTDVSAKYRGAFCEAKVKKIAKSLRCKVFIKEIQSSLIVTDEFITGNLMMGNVVEVRHPDTGRIMEGVVNKMFDTSMYTVVFDDGDERTLRRTQLCLKGDKHFTESETLDNLPLSNPEQFGTPVISGKGKRRSSGIGSGTQEDSEDSSEDELNDSRKSLTAYSDLVGKLMFHDAGEKKKPYLLPVLVVIPEAHPTTLKSKDHMLVRSFKDNKFLSVVKKELIPFTREVVLKNEDKTLKVPMEKALLYIDNRELPVSWNKEELFGPDYDSDFDEEKSDEDSEPSEEEDRFVAQLYKFCDDRGTPINKAPSVGSKDLNLYKLFKIVQKLGGYNRVTNQMKWRLVYSKMQLPPSNTASTQIKNAYKKYLHAFEDFYRKLGSTMGTISRPGRNRHDSGRSILNFRGREKEALAREVIAKEAAKELEKSLDTSKDETKSEKADDSVSEVETESEQGTPGGTPKRPKSARLKPEVRLIKDDKELKTDKKDKKDSSKKEEQKSVKKTVESEQKTVKKAVESEQKTVKKTVESEQKTVKKAVESEQKTVKKAVESEQKTVKKTVESNNEKDSTVKTEKVKEGKTQEEKQDEGKKEKDEGKKEKDEGKKPTENKPVEKKEAKIKVMKKEVEEDKDSKQLGRRRITRTDEESEEKKDKKEPIKKEEIKEEAKPKKTEQKSKETEKDTQKTVGKDDKKIVKKDTVKTTTKKDEKAEKLEDDEDTITAPAPVIPSLNDLPLGTKMRVRYGRGRNQREYEAKIIEVGADSTLRQYLVHYAGWNNRHDEWIKPERIVRIIHKPDQKVGLKTSPMVLKKPGKKKLSTDKSPASPSSVASSDSGMTPTSGRGRPTSKSKSPASSAVPPAAAAKGRPTRSNSVEQVVVTGLQPKRRPKKSVDKLETSKGSESEESDKSDAEEETSVEMEKKDQGKNSMPSIADAAVTEKIADEIDDNKNIDRSPPQLSKVTDIVKDKTEEDENEKVEVKSDSKETEEPAPILNVVEREKSNEPILQKIEAQLIASSPLKVDVKEKEVKKKDTVEKKPKKGLFKVDEECVKKVEKVMELKLSPVVSKVSEESPYEFKDETEVEPELPKERKKPVVLMEDYRKESPRKESPRKESPRRTWHENEGSNLLQKIEKVEKEEVGIVPVVKNLTEVKDFSKSDSEVEKVERVERRGRKRKDVKEREQKEKELREKEMKIMQENIRRGKTTQADKTPVVTEAKVTGSPEKRTFVTLAERKQVYSPCKSALENLETARLQKAAIDAAAENKTDQRKQTDTVVVHKAFDAVKGLVDIDPVSKSESGVSSDLMTPTIVRGGSIPVNAEEKQESAETEKKKVRKRPKKKESREEVMLNLYGPKKKLGGRRKRNTDNQEKESVENSANSENKTDIDLLCDEKIRSRSASPESKKPNIDVDDSQGFGPLFEAVECKLKESQQNQDSAVSREYKTSFKGNLFENTPPSTPEHDSDGASQNSQEPVKNSASGSAMDTSSKLGVSQPVGSESPWGIGNTSPSSGSSGVIASSEGSIDVVVNSTKRRRESNEPTPTKRRKRVSRNKSYNRSKLHESDSEEASNLSAKCRSPHYSSDSYASRSSQLVNRNRSPRPPKYNFNLEEGKYLEGNQRISFLVDKIQEIRKIYMGLKAEVACIDRRRKRARRREKERENARNTSSGEVECS